MLNFLTILATLGAMSSAIQPTRLRPPTRYSRENRANGAAAQPEEKFIMMDTDHFNAEGKSAQFSMRYLVDDTHYREGGPILFYAGNEGDIYSFYDNSGFMTETIAQETGGMVVFGEHRYFGVSYPFPPEEAILKNLSQKS